MNESCCKGDRLLRVAVFGAGVFGRHHLRIYRQLERDGAPIRLAAVVEPNAAARAALHSDPGLLLGLGDEAGRPPVFASVEECLRSRRKGDLTLDAVSICVPTSAHAETASLALGEGLDVLLEKPISLTLEQADALIRQADDGARILQIGHLERFNPAVAAVRPLLNRPMFFEAHRLSVFHPRSLDVDVVLDLMIHDLDIVLSLAASPVRSLHAVGLPVLTPAVDIANVRVEFESGCVANFTASRVSTEKVRKLRFFQPHQYISIDYARQDLLVIDVTHAPEGAPAGVNFNPSSLAALSPSKPRVLPGEPLKLEIEAFLASVRSRVPSPPGGRDGRDALDLALRINAAIAAHAAQAGLQPRRHNP